MTVDERIYGSDIFLENGDMQISNNGDLQFIDSLENVGQAVKHALSTEKGSLFYSPDYGINLLGIIGNKNISIIQTRLKNEIIKILSNDYRIQRIDQLTVEQNKDIPSQMDIFIKLQPIESMNTIDISLSYPYPGVNVPSNSVTNETQISATQLTVSTIYSIYSIAGVWLATDTNKSGINYFTGGFINYNNVNLGTPLPTSKTKVIIDYTTLNVINKQQIRQIFSEQIFCNNGLDMMTLYNIFDIAGLWETTDTYKATNLVDTVRFSNKNIQFITPITSVKSYFIDYSTYDDTTA